MHISTLLVVSDMMPDLEVLDIARCPLLAVRFVQHGWEVVTLHCIISKLEQKVVFCVVMQWINYHIYNIASTLSALTMIPGVYK